MKGLAAALLMLFCTSSLWSQEIPKVEVFGGYSYVNADTNGLAAPSRQSANGWEASASGNVNNWFAVEGDFSGYYKSGIDVPALGGGTASLQDFAFAAGPRVNLRPVFFHALLGVSHLTGSVPGFPSESQNSFAGAFGGGVQWKVAPQWAVRASADYVLTRHNIFELLDVPSGSAITQNNFRVSVGVVFFIGGIGESSPRASGRKPNASEPCEPVSETVLLGVAGCATVRGLKITIVQPGSPGASAGINPGDIVVKIDGRPVQSGRDIELAIGASQTGTINVGYLIRGTWLTEREVKVR
jgi:opacity protein-like surface antigen